MERERERNISRLLLLQMFWLSKRKTKSRWWKVQPFAICCTGNNSFHDIGLLATKGLIVITNSFMSYMSNLSKLCYEIFQVALKGNRRLNWWHPVWYETDVVLCFVRHERCFGGTHLVYKSSKSWSGFTSVCHGRFGWIWDPLMASWLGCQKVDSLRGF